MFNSGLQLLSSLPEPIKSHTAIIADAKRRKKKSANYILLDLAIHQSAFSNSKFSIENIGRPDIVHHCLLAYLQSPVLQLWGNLIKFYVHTTQNQFFLVPNNWHIPSSYIRFRGLLEHLLSKGYLKTNDKTIRLKNGSVKELIEKTKEKNKEIKTILATRHGKRLSLAGFQEKMLNSLHSDTMYNLLIGGHQTGPPPEEIIALADEQISISSLKLPSFNVVNLLMASLEFSEKFLTKEEERLAKEKSR